MQCIHTLGSYPFVCVLALYIQSDLIQEQALVGKILWFIQSL